jgi:molecular chaperone DnaK
MVLEAEMHAEEDRSKMAYSEAVNEAQVLLYSTEQTISEFADRFSSDEIAKIRAAMDVVSDIKDQGPQAIDELKDASERLQILMHRFAELMYSAPDSSDTYD